MSTIYLNPGSTFNAEPVGPTILPEVATLKSTSLEFIVDGNALPFAFFGVKGSPVKGFFFKDIGVLNPVNFTCTPFSPLSSLIMLSLNELYSDTIDAMSAPVKLVNPVSAVLLSCIDI